MKTEKRRGLLAAAALCALLALALGCMLLWDPFTRTKIMLAEGLSTQTPLYVLDSGKPGKTILFLAGAHGNEEAGYEAARLMVNALRPKAGKILLIPEANRPAIEAYTRTTPEGVNMNRVYPGRDDGNDVERLCAQITELIASEQPVAVIDMHEGFNFYGVDGSIGNSIVVGLNDESFMFLPELLDYVNGRNGDLPAFTYETNAPVGSLNGEMHRLIGVDTYTIETSQKLNIETRIRQQLTFVEGLLTLYGIPYSMDQSAYPYSVDQSPYK